MHNGFAEDFHLLFAWKLELEFYKIEILHFVRENLRRDVTGYDTFVWACVFLFL